MKRELIAVGVGLGMFLSGARGCNNLWNNKYIRTSAHETNSYATGLTGHVEYSRYADGSRDIKIYPGFGHRLFDSKLYQDLDGDGDVDRIRENNGGWKMNSLDRLSSKEVDYILDRDEFDEADKVLKELINKYGK